MAMTTTDQDRDRDDVRHRKTTLSGSGRNRRLALLCAAALAAVALIVAVVWVATRPARTYDPGSPEGVVQTYVAAVLNRDAPKAAGLLSAGSRCVVADFDSATVPTNTSVELISTQLQGATASIRIRVSSQDAGDPLGGNPGEEYVLRLTRSGTAWHIDGTPWPLWICTGA
jgi:hypothetical protein